MTISLDKHSEKTLVLYGPENAIEVIQQFYSRVEDVSNLITDTSGPQAIFQVKEYNDILMDLIKRGIKRRLITEITKENLGYCKKLVQLVELRHLEGVKGNFAVSETEYMATAILHKTEPLTQVIYSNASALVEQHCYLFDTLWNKAIPAEQVIQGIEDGIEPDFFEVIIDKARVGKLLQTLAESAKREILFLLPNDKAVIRVKRLGILDTLKEASHNGAIVKIMCPINDNNSEIIEQLRKESRIEFANGNETQSGIMITDFSRFVSAELAHPTSEEFTEAIGIALYSNSKRTISLLHSFFDSLWNQAELYERLEIQEKLEKEFINIAAHELRTPVQPILAMTEIIDSSSKDDKSILVATEDLAIIRRNALRLERLTSDILEIARIESGSLNLRREKCNLDDIVKHAIDDVRNHFLYNGGNVSINNKNVTINYRPADIMIDVDKGRILEVICNLLDNAIRFTREGSITISTESTKDEIVVTIRDTGEGIDKEIMPRLFSKFVTKSEKGTGLGLFISKSIIEAHDCRIWAKNNEDEVGATLYFTLPLANRI